MGYKEKVFLCLSLLTKIFHLSTKLFTHFKMTWWIT